ncbi:HNH endonuclease [Bacillus sp. ISL-7]|uniref:HNH endonuclease n=1 Tax=Bacillus sp. ISL-7 TaxID=2819136 RepID=UPI001BE55014|nr:HNH endonuclease [Bacillus sp. ISL-7]MBT2736208.1 HNH endonuclease [Bacillus sp. ISL-7]
MPIPKNITKKHVIEAIKKVDSEGVPERRESTRFNLSYEGKYYPPKYVISIANIFANGEEYPPSLFSGGDETNRFFRGLGFSIIENEINTIGNQNEGNLLSVPALEPVSRSREYNLYEDPIRDRVVYESLFHGRTRRWLDEHIIGLNPDESRGYQAMGILHFIGLKDKHKGIFKGLSIHEAVQLLEQQDSDFSLVIQCLNRINNLIENSQKLVEVITDDIDSEKAEDDSYYKDGAVKQYYGKRYERNPENRKKAIEIHGLKCVACGFNFEEVYGERGKDFIEVHHVKPLSTIGEEVTIEPKEDLVPVCSNCHRMIHRRKDDVLTVEELKFMISQRK